MGRGVSGCPFSISSSAHLLRSAMISVAAAGVRFVARVMQTAQAAMQLSFHRLNEDTIYLILAATHDFDDLRNLALTCSSAYKVYRYNARLLEIQVLGLSPGASSARAVGIGLRYIRVSKSVKRRGNAAKILDKHPELNYLLETSRMSREEARELQRLSHVVDWLEMCYVHKYAAGKRNTAYNTDATLQMCRPRFEENQLADHR